MKSLYSPLCTTWRDFHILRALACISFMIVGACAIAQSQQPPGERVASEGWFPLENEQSVVGVSYESVLWDDGTGPALVIATSERVLRWDGKRWQRLGEAFDGNVVALEVDASGVLIAGGNFGDVGNTSANNIAKFDQGQWVALGSGVNGSVTDIVSNENDGDLIVGGSFTRAGTFDLSGLAKWDGTDWVPAGPNLEDGARVQALTFTSDGDLVVGGDFSETASGTMLNNIAWLDGNQWQPFASGVEGRVQALKTLSTGDIIAGGEFETAGEANAKYVALWNGLAWSPVGDGLEGRGIYAINTRDDGSLVVAGEISSASGIQVNNIVRLNNGSWESFGSGLFRGSVVGLGSSPTGQLVAVGRFLTTGQVGGFSGVAIWTGDRWDGFGQGIDGNVFATLIDSNGDLVIGGSFGRVDGVGSPGVARWDGQSWSSLGFNATVAVYALTLFDGTIYAGGDFSLSNLGSNVARWDSDTGSWEPVGTGFDGSVRALAVDQTNSLYAGGRFRTIGGAQVDYVARWDGSAWENLEGELNGAVRTLTSNSTGILFAGGEFTSVEGGETLRVASYDGSGWNSLGSGIGKAELGESVIVLIGDGRGLVAGGFFEAAGGTQVNSIARWDGTSWQALGSGVDGAVLGLERELGGAIVASGNFRQAGGLPTNSIARFNEGSWSSLDGGGLKFEGLAVVSTDDGTLYAGGAFLSAGDVPARAIAGYGLREQTTTTIVEIEPRAVDVPITFTVEVEASEAPTSGYVSIAGTPGGQCTAEPLVAINGTTSRASCQLSYQVQGSYTVTASYSGGVGTGARWAASTSAPIGFSTAGDLVFDDRFEASE